MRGGLITILTVAFTTAFTLTWTGCTSEPEQASEPKEPQAGQPAAAKLPAKHYTVEELLAMPPPALGPIGQQIEQLAQHYQVGVFRCPINGMGRVSQKFGTERDLVAQIGPMWEMELDPATTPVWDPIFDEVTVEDQWVTGLAMPGATRSWVRGRGEKTWEFEHPPAAAGTTVICTSSKEMPPRVVKGKVKPLKEHPFKWDALVVRCGEISAQPAYIAEDGTYEMETRVPCTIWAERPGYRSEKIRVESGTEPFEANFELVRDPLQLADGGWTPEGKQKVEEMLGRVKERWTQTGTWLEKEKAAHDKGTPTGQRVAFLARDHEIYGTRIEGAKRQLDAPPEDKKAKAPAPRESQPALGLGGGHP